MPSERSCSDCTVLLTHQVSLTDEEGGGLTEHTLVMAGDGRGRFFIVPTPKMNQVVVFDSTGTQIGRIGPGYGRETELSLILGVEASRGDTIHVFDGRGGRWLVVSPALEPLLTRPLPAPPKPGGAKLMPGGSLVFNATIRTPERIGLPLHHMEPSGHRISSFGHETGYFRPGIPNLGFRRFAVADSSTVWAAHPNRFEFELWDVRGRVIKRLVREVNWPTMGTLQARAVPARKEPSPEIRDLKVSREGYLWVLLSIPDEEWETAIPEDPREGEGTRPDSWDGYLDTVIEVIDPLEGRLITSRRFDQFLFRFLGESLVASFNESHGKVGTIEVWRADLETQPN